MGLGLLQALTEANVANIEILNRACLRWSSTTWSTIYQPSLKAFPGRKLRGMLLPLPPDALVLSKAI
jgi:hypothetical protein